MKKVECELPKKLLKRILKESVDISDEIYQKDFKNFTLKVNWDICGVIGYQIYEQTKYTYKYGEILDDADVTISIQNIEHVKQMLRGGGFDIEMSRGLENNFQICTKDSLLIAQFKKEGTNPRVISQLPIFNDLQKQMVFGKTLFKQPDNLLVEKDEIESLMKKMLRDSDRVLDEDYQKTFKDRVFKVNWDIDGILAYQVFEETNYTFEFGKNLDDADVTLIFENLVYAKLLLQGIPIDITHTKDANNNFQLCVKVPMITTRFKDPSLNPLVLTKLPFSKTLPKKKTEQEDKGEEYGSYIPVNLSAGEYENEVIPLKIFEHFINKASNIVVCHCYCRLNNDCQSHSKSHGCMYMGDDTKNMVLHDKQRILSKEEAVQFVKEAIEDGLIPVIGRSVGETEGQSIKDTGHFLSSCFCCSCCCVNGRLISNASASMLSGNIIKRIEGLEVKIDPTKCVGCGTCLEVCVFKGREILEEKATIDPELCLGCGRCVEVCPEGAISIEIEDTSNIDKMIAKIQNIVDVEPQKTQIVA
ncbi:MAG: DUF362 domain-containing protein [Promethearchaeota archaeon]